MIRILLKTIMMTTFSSLLFISQMDAYCARCMKIEEERAKEQTAHPQTNERQFLVANQNTNEVVNNQRITNQQLDSGQFFEEDTVLTETGPEFQEKEEFKERKHKTAPSISRDYSMIYTILKTKNFLETLDGNFTLFIPTNKAFQQLPPNILISLNQQENAEKLAALVSNHVVAKKILRNDFASNNNLEVKAISGRNLTLSYKNGNLYIDDILILHAEPAGFDGVIYIIDKVLVP